MAKPITITLLGDLDDLSRSLGAGASDVTDFGSRVEEALREATEEAGRLGDEVASAGDEASDEMGSFADRFGGLAAAAGVAVGAGLVAGIGEAMSREAGSDLLAAQLGASPEEAKRLGEAAGAIYTSGWGESVAEANAALKALWQQGLVPAGATAGEMEKIGKSAMDVAAVLGDEVGPTANAVGQMLKTGMAKNASEAFDILVRGAQVGGNKAEDLLDTFNEYSTQFRKMGLDGKDAMGLISQGLQGGARDADIVADAIKEFSIRAIDGSTTTADGFKAIGLNADDMRAKIAAGGPAAREALGLTLDRLRAIKDPADRSAAAVALFGTQAEDLGEALYSMDVDTAVSALGRVDGAAKKAGDTMHDNAAQRITAFWRGLQTLAVDVIGGTVLPALGALADGLAATGRWAERHRVPILAVASVITVVLLPALVAWGATSVTAGAKAVGAWITTATTSTTSAATQVAASWAVVGGWLRAAGQAVISGAVIVGQWIAAAARAVWAGGVMVAQWILMGTQATIQAARMAAAWLVAMGPIPLIIAAVVGLAALIWANWDKIKQATSTAFQAVWDKIRGVFGLVRNLFANFTGPGLLLKHWDTIKSATAGAFRAVRERAREGLDAVVSLVRGLPSRIVSAASAVLGAGRTVGGRVVDGLKAGLSRLGGFASSLGAVVTSATKGAVNGVVDLLNGAIPNRLGWGRLSIDLPDSPIPHVRAMGGPAQGLTRVGERGPEWLSLPKGSSVVPNHAQGQAGGVVVNVQTNADPHAIGREVAWALRAGAR
ncbi:phage tail tape measure protein [Streptomyces sp. CC224B]|uniref:phage tail tape measure protein n=1 Tax=Streptomyces sp. CC224B TaxID=3044571 RepID=UPI0024A82B18|nr:phage tail tape measure protein [Streptomyces sp. CC224B]